MASNISNGEKIHQEKMGVSALASPLGNIWFVDSVNGSDGNRGVNRRHAVKTLTQAVANAAAGDTIVLNPGGSEIITATVAVSKQLKIVCPVQQYTISGAGTLDLVTVSAAGCHLEGLRLKHTGATASANGVLTTAAADDLVCERCEVDDSAITTTFTGNGFQIVDDLQNFRINNCLARDCKRGVYVNVATGKNQIGGWISGQFWVGRAASFGIEAVHAGTGTIRGLSVVGCLFLEANGDGSVAAAAWDGKNGVTATQGPISLSSAVDQFSIVGCSAGTSLITGFETLLAVAAGAVGSQTDNKTPHSLGSRREEKFAYKSTGSMASGYGTADSPKAMFTVTGAVLINGVVGVVVTPVTSTGATGTLALGTTDSTGFLIPATTADGTNFGTAGDVWVDATPTDNVDVMARSGAPVIVGGGAAINLTIATNNMTAGNLDLYIKYQPLSANGLIVAA